MRTRKTVIVLISGKARNGKTTVADLLEKKLEDIPSMRIFRYAFAGPIKYIAKAFMNWDGEKDEKGRRLLQEQGRIGRDYDQDIWVKHLLNQMDKKTNILPFNFVIVDDWRFPNELAYLQTNPILDVVTIRVLGRSLDMPGNTASDISENSLPEASEEHLKAGSYSEFEPMLYYDYIINNNEDLNLLESKVDMVLSQISKQYIVE